LTGTQFVEIAQKCAFHKREETRARSSVPAV